MSILDFLGDDGTEQITEVKPANEDHVAFSVDGNLPVYLKTNAGFTHLLDVEDAIALECTSLQ